MTIADRLDLNAAFACFDQCESLLLDLRTKAQKSPALEPFIPRIDAARKLCGEERDVLAEMTAVADPAGTF